jgi:hypothetical protein
MGAYVAYIAYVAAQRRGMVSTFTEMAENWLRQQATAEAQPEMIQPADEPPPPLPLHDPAEWREPFVRWLAPMCRVKQVDPNDRCGVAGQVVTRDSSGGSVRMSTQRSREQIPASSATPSKTSDVNWAAILALLITESMRVFKYSMGITKVPAKYFLPIGSAASPLAKTALFWRIHGLVPHLK